MTRNQQILQSIITQAGELIKKLDNNDFPEITPLLMKADSSLDDALEEIEFQNTETK